LNGQQSDKGYPEKFISFDLQHGGGKIGKQHFGLRKSHRTISAKKEKSEYGVAGTDTAEVID